GQAPHSAAGEGAASLRRRTSRRPAKTAGAKPPIRRCSGMTGWTRRSLLGAGGAALLAPSFAGTQPQRRSRLVLLGTKGGPTPSRFRAPASNLLIVDGEPYVIDAPDGVASRLVQAGVNLARLKYIFITHNHSDHVAGLGALLILAWGSGLQTPVDIYGPAPLRRLVAAHLAANAYDIEARRREEGRPALASISDGNAPRLMDHLRRSHTTTGQLGRIAEAAGVRTLVLSHLVPALPTITDEMWTEGVRRHFRGRIIVGRDMLEI